MTDPVVIVSADCHIGPRLVEDLRPLCPADLLGAFDAYVADGNRSKGRYVEHDATGDDDLSPWRNQFSAGHHDPEERRRDMDREGVAAEVLFHGSQNDQPVPFQSSMLGAPDDPDLYAAGIRIYNTWLAETCAAAPERHVGLAHLPMWDVDLAVDELRWAADAGLRGVNFPAPRPWLPPYNDRAWEPLWAAAEELAMPLSTHSGAGDPAVFQGPELVALMSIESGGWFSRRAAHLLIFAGVFERHPDLRAGAHRAAGRVVADHGRRARLGASGQHRDGRSPGPPGAAHPPASTSTATSTSAPASSRATRPRGRSATATPTASCGAPTTRTWSRPGSEGPTAYSPMSIRFALAGLDEATARAIVGGTAIDVYGLDADGAGRPPPADIGAPTWSELSEPLERGAQPAPAPSRSARAAPGTDPGSTQRSVASRGDGRPADELSLVLISSSLLFRLSFELVCATAARHGTGRGRRTAPGAARGDRGSRSGCPRRRRSWRPVRCSTGSRPGSSRPKPPTSKPGQVEVDGYPNMAAFLRHRLPR